MVAWMLLRRRLCAVLANSFFASVMLATVLVLWKCLQQIPPVALTAVLGEDVEVLARTLEIFGLPVKIFFVVIGVFSFVGFLCFFTSSVREYRPELAWLRVTGVTRWSLLRLLVLQGVLVAGWVVLFGVGIGYATLFWLQDALVGQSFVFNMPQVWEIIVFSAVFAAVVLASLWSAVMAARTPVDDILGRL
jgi:hypothetical protein